MALQSTVTQFQRPYARGMIVNAEARNLISRSLAASAFALGFGEPVYRAAGNGGDTQCSADAAAGLFLGISRRVGTLDPANATVDTFATNDEVPIMMDGVIGVDVAGAVLAGAAANFNTTTRLWTSAAVAGAIIAVADCEFDSTTTGAGQAKLRVKRVAVP
jgi:hypothetical protein